MSEKCVICNIQEFRNGRSSRLFKISHHPKLNLGFMLTFVSGLEVEQDSCLCITCSDELETAFNFKQKWHQSKLYKVENLKSDSVALNNQYHTMEENDKISYKILEVKIEAQNELGEDSSCVPLTPDTEKYNTNNDEWWRCFKREKSIEIEDMYGERLANREIASMHDVSLAYKTEDVDDEMPNDQIQEVIQIMISEDSSELAKLSKQNENRRNNEQDQATIRCEICYKSFTKISTCRIHLKRIHAVEKNPNRSVKGRRKYPISEHDIFNNLKETQCEFCFKICRNLDGLDNHKKCHEKEEQPYRCNKAGCPSRFAYKHRARSHIVNHEEKRFKCRYCDKMFNYSYNAVVHERTHTGEKPYACTYCGRAFASFYNMNAHTRLHTGEEPYKCSHCPKTFKSHSAHKIHEQSHSHTKPYNCSVCGKAFISSWHCKSHERIHSGEKPYKCQICKKAFIDSTRLGAHKKIHTGTAPKGRRKVKKEKLEI